jgi:hypothetical protein
VKITVASVMRWQSSKVGKTTPLRVDCAVIAHDEVFRPRATLCYRSPHTTINGAHGIETLASAMLHPYAAYGKLPFDRFALVELHINSRNEHILTNIYRVSGTICGQYRKISASEMSSPRDGF